jgi:excisionase family DNA binding protein
MSAPSGEPGFEKLYTYKAAAELLGVPYFKIQRAARAKLIPTYRLLNGRRLLKLSEVLAAIEASREANE